MELKYLFANLRNEVDFFLRSQIRVGRPLPPTAPIPAIDRWLQPGIRGVYPSFRLEKASLAFQETDCLEVADIGARNFRSAQLSTDFFLDRKFLADIHGIEIDACRRLRDFRTPGKISAAYAAQMRQGHFHAMDFFDWEKPLKLSHSC